MTDAYGSRGGIGKFNRDLLAALASFPATERIEVYPRVIVEEVIAVPSNVDFRSESAGSHLDYAAAVLRRLLSGPRPDLIICGHIYLTFFAKLLALRFQAPTLLIVHGIEAWEPPPRMLQRRFASSMDRAIAVSDRTRARFLSWSAMTGEAVGVIPNCVDVSAYAPGAKPTYLLERHGLHDASVLLTVGRMVGIKRAKGFDEVLELMPGLSEDIHYVMVGDGPDRERLEEKSRRLGISRRVHFAGYIPEHEKADYYRLADLYVMPSRGEGFGIVFLEAMASGVPVIASTEDGGFEAIREGRLGVAVDPSDSGALHTAVEKGLSRTAPDRSELEYFSSEAFQERWHRYLLAQVN